MAGAAHGGRYFMQERSVTRTFVRHWSRLLCHGARHLSPRELGISLTRNAYRDPIQSRPKTLSHAKIWGKVALSFVSTTMSEFERSRRRIFHPKPGERQNSIVLKDIGILRNNSFEGAMGPFPSFVPSSPISSVRSKSPGGTLRMDGFRK